MKSLFCCPLCSAPLESEERRLLCPSGHSFDRAAAGYVHLLPANRKHSRDPGDDKAMVAARAAFLDKGYYAPLRETLCRAVKEAVSELPEPVVVDSGCGVGYYAEGLWAVLPPGGRLAGVDLSRAALRRAAKRVPEAEFAAASVYRMPLGDRSADVLVNVFSPLAAEEFARVLRPGGLLCYAVPSARHLWEMKEILYQRPYENPVRREAYPGFRWMEVRELRYTLELESREDILALFGMTPYAWKTPRDGVKRLELRDRLSCEAGFDLHLYRREEAGEDRR